MAERRRATFTDASTPFLGVEVLRGEEGGDLPSEAEIAGTEIRMVHPGGPEALQLLEIRMAPGLRVLPHAHEEDEIFYVVEGELRFGSRLLGVGSSVAIPARTRYAFNVGAEGVRFLNFRKRSDASYLPGSSD